LRELVFWADSGKAKSSGRAVVYLICSMAKAEETLEISIREISFL
jgi:hypothetical protein